MIGRVITLTMENIVDKVQFGDIIKIFFKVKEEPNLTYVGNLLSISTSGKYTVLVTGDDKYNLDPEAENV